MDDGKDYMTVFMEGSCGPVEEMLMTPYEGLPVFFGLNGYWLLTGLFVSQLVKYFSHYGCRDRILVQITVYIVALTTVLYSCSVSFIAWRFFSRRHNTGRPPAALPVLSTLPSPTIAFVSTIVHLFFVWRIHMLRRTSRSVSCVCVFVVSLSLTQFICAVINFAQFNIAGRKPSGKRHFNTLTTLWLIGGLMCDIIITITTYILLFQVRERSRMMKGTSRLLTKLISGTLETGLPTSIMATAVLVTFIAYSETNFDMCFMFLLYIVYANAFLIALNSRQRLRSISSNTMTSTGIHAAIGASTGISSTGSKDGSQPELKHRGETDLEALKGHDSPLDCLNELDITDSR